ncbi:hypothetical protein CWB41_15915 [Methylovirgula ligni]|uniref:Uncharacterized protein n=1 Tax=Methylovirgula ligni TaxID=569860 RepID=A0A3D9YYW5_9HYPH|nr:hypothetical protein [Methylovirgula ligni]QAY97039.1 hypothetical protein CWB41_15915 [Methylovirgula ligni]REF87892.1 hypothetical protein DES32_1529 [Methylovirgula ligni]
MTVSYLAGRYYAAAPAGARFKSAPLQSGLLLATPFTLTENLELTAIELVSTSLSVQQGVVKVALYSAINGVPSGAPVLTVDVRIPQVGRALWQVPTDGDGNPIPVALLAGSYFVVTMTVGNLTLRAIDGSTQEIESVFGRSDLSDPRPVSALTLPGAAVTALPLTFTGTESWQDWHGPAAAPAVYLAS